MEYELKFKIANTTGILKKLARLGAKDLGRKKETDIFIGKACQGLRLRKFGREGLVTHKRIVETKTRAKVREELETRVSDVDHLLEMFRILGFPETKRREKIRRTFRLGNALVLIDRIPFLGYFIEIEASSGTALKNAVRKLGLDRKQASADSYDNIFFNHYILNAAKYKHSRTTILPTFESERQFLRQRPSKHG